MNFECADIVSWARAYTGPKFHGVLCDPPYELGFMGKHWDKSGVAFQPDTWAAVSDCLVPGAHLLTFGGTRTFHRLACAIEDAGFEIRDCVMWVYGSGFPKSLDVSKAIDKEAGEEREVIGEFVTGSAYTRADRRNANDGFESGQVIRPLTSPATPAAIAWNGYGTALKPAWEPVIVARKPIEGTVAQNCQAHGAGALNIDGGRIGSDTTVTNRSGNSGVNGVYGRDTRIFKRANPPGRWPANVIHDGSDEVLAGFPQTGPSKAASGVVRFGRSGGIMGDVGALRDGRSEVHDDNGGSAARFFYCAKASKAERDAGLDGMPRKFLATMNDGIGQREHNPDQPTARVRNHHPTVKPLALCEYLARLILPPPVVQPRRLLVPFAGTGSEAIGAMRAGWDEVLGVEREHEYVDIAIARAKYWRGEICLTG